MRKNASKIADTNLVAAMTDAILDCHALRGAATEDDLRTRGFSADDIDRLGDKAVAAAKLRRPSALRAAA